LHSSGTERSLWYTEATWQTFPTESISELKIKLGVAKAQAREQPDAGRKIVMDLTIVY
jgi:hypothetical protein